jgi:membrane protease YdiL (CAAX protease family)
MQALIKTDQKKISVPLLIALHLLPGVLFGGVFFALSWMFIHWGLTGYLALLVAIPIILAPIETGIMLLWSKRETGKRSLSAVIDYHHRGSAIDYILIPFLLFICWGILSILISPISLYLEAHLPAWLPAWATQEALVNGILSSSPPQRSITFGLAVLFSGLIAPVVEELYFRGFLLPRMEYWGWSAPVMNALLFALYHFYFPGNVLGIFVAFIPISYVVVLKKNWRIGLVFHCMVNLWGVYNLTTLFI